MEKGQQSLAGGEVQFLLCGTSAWFSVGVRLSLFCYTGKPECLDITKSTTVILVDKWTVSKVCIGAKSTQKSFAKHNLVISAGLCFLLRSLFVLVLLPWKPMIVELFCCSLGIARSRKCKFIHGWVLPTRRSMKTSVEMWEELTSVLLTRKLSNCLLHIFWWDFFSLEILVCVVFWNACLKAHP